MPPPKAVEVYNNPATPEWQREQLRAKYPELGAAPAAAPEAADPESASGLEAFVRGAAHTFSGGFGDDMFGLGAALGPDTPRSAVRGSMTDVSGPATGEDARQVAQAEDAAVREEHPWLYGGGALAAGVPLVMAGGAGLARAAPGLVRAFGTLGPVTQGAVAGGGMGAVTGAGDAAPGNRLEGAVEGAETGAVTGGLLPMLATLLGPLAAPLSNAANRQRIKAYEHDTQTARVEKAAPDIAEAEATGVNPRNADAKIKAAAGELEALLKAELPAEHPTLPVPAVIRNPKAPREPLPAELAQQGPKPDLDADTTTLPVPFAPNNGTRLPAPPKVPREFGEAPTEPSLPGVETPDAAPAAPQTLADLRIDTRPMAAELQAKMDKIADLPVNKAVRSRYARAIASFEGEEGLTLQQAIRQKQLLDAKTYGPMGAKESIAAKEAAEQGALLRQRIDAALGAHPELKAAFEKYNREIELANRVKELGKAPIKGPPENAVQTAMGMINFMGLPVNAGAASALRGASNTLGSGAANLQPELGALSGILPGAAPGLIPPSLVGLDEVRRDEAP